MENTEKLNKNLLCSLNYVLINLKKAINEAESL